MRAARVHMAPAVLPFECGVRGARKAHAEELLLSVARGRAARLLATAATARAAHAAILLAVAAIDVDFADAVL